MCIIYYVPSNLSGANHFVSQIPQYFHPWAIRSLGVGRGVVGGHCESVMATSASMDPLPYQVSFIPGLEGVGSTWRESCSLQVTKPENVTPLHYFHEILVHCIIFRGFTFRGNCNEWLNENCHNTLFGFLSKIIIVWFVNDCIHELLRNWSRKHY